ncbi:MAG: hypothetical protein ACLS63_03350 [Flavonifractor plautii]
MNRGRANPIKLLAAYLAGLPGGRIASLSGGLTHNAIPAQAEAVVFCPAEPDLSPLRGALADYRAADPGLTVACAPAERPERAWTPAFRPRLADGAVPRVYAMEPAFPGTVGPPPTCRAGTEGMFMRCAPSCAPPGRSGRRSWLAGTWPWGRPTGSPCPSPATPAGPATGPTPWRRCWAGCGGSRPAGRWSSPPSTWGWSRRCSGPRPRGWSWPPPGRTFWTPTRWMSGHPWTGCPITPLAGAMEALWDGRPSTQYNRVQARKYAPPAGVPAGGAHVYA